VSVAKANGGFVRKATLPLFNALERADCTTTAAAKKLSADADCLQGVDSKLRSIFVPLVSEAEPTGMLCAVAVCCIPSSALPVEHTLRHQFATQVVCDTHAVSCLLVCTVCSPLLAFTAVIDTWDEALQITDCTAPMDRPLYLLINDEQVQAADPQDKLYYSLVRSWDCRTIAQAKAFSTEGTALLNKGGLYEGVAEAALDRFLQLVTAAELTGELNFIQQSAHRL
jgi:hypothetical protein